MNEGELRSEFEQRKPSLKMLGELVTIAIINQLEIQLGSKMAADKFLQISPKPRVKETDSFLEKALVRKPKDDPLTEITDQVGVRFVVLLLEDIDRIGRIIQTGQWYWQKDRDHERERLEKPDYFAYQSDHYVIRTQTPLDIDGVIIPTNTPCEIQVRTILQHAYAEMAHFSDYKPSIRLPEEDQRQVKRSLAKGSALIETTDGVFKEIKQHMRDYDASVTALLVRSAEIYFDITGEVSSPATQLGLTVADAYRELLKETSSETLKQWSDARPALGQILKAKRIQSVFYRDSFVILLGWLITEHQTAIPKRWPVDTSYLEDYYTALGISTDGIF